MNIYLERDELPELIRFIKSQGWKIVDVPRKRDGRGINIDIKATKDGRSIIYCSTSKSRISARGDRDSRQLATKLLQSFKEPK